MKRLAALIFILALLLVPASAHEEEVYTFPLEFTALASGVSGTPSPLALPQTGSFDPAAPTYGAQLKDDSLAVAAYELLETELAPGVTELSLDVAAYNLTPSDWLTDVTPALGSAVAAFVYDHPESQYCTIAQYGYATSRGQIVRVIYLITEQSDAAARQAALENYLADFAAGFDRTLPAAEQYRRIHDLVCRTVTYDYEAAASGVPGDAHTAHGALVLNNLAVCEGYAKAFKVLCDAVDLPCLLIVGEAQQSGVFYGSSNHMWNAIPLDGAWYAVDTTWDDESTLYPFETLALTTIDYPYFLQNSPFLEGSPDQDHRSSGNIYFAGNFPMTFGLPTLAEGSHPSADGLTPTEGTITFQGGTLSVPNSLWSVTYGDGFVPGTLTTITLTAENSPVAAAPLSLPADRHFICAIAAEDVTRAEGFDGPLFTVSGQFDLPADLTDPDLFTMTDTAVVHLYGDLALPKVFVMERGTLHIHGDLSVCVDYRGGTLTVNGDSITADVHHLTPSGCLCGALTSCPHDFAEVVNEACLATPATCSAPAVYYKSCSICGAAGTETFSHGEPAPHDFAENLREEHLLTPATCTSQAVYRKSCTYCGLAGEEVFSAGDLAPHTTQPILLTPATCTSPALWYDLCSVCAAQSDPYPLGENAPHADSDGDLRCDACSADLSGGASGILSLTADSITLRTGAGLSDILLCVAAYDADGRMAGVFFHPLTIVPEQLFTLTHTAAGDDLRAWVLQPGTFAPLYSTN